MFERFSEVGEDTATSAFNDGRPGKILDLRPPTPTCTSSLLETKLLDLTEMRKQEVKEYRYILKNKKYTC